MKKIIHEDERIIEILAMFAEEIKTGRVREGEAIDKTACMLTAYMEGVVKARVSDESLLGQQNDTMTPTMEEVAGWLREAANQQTIIARAYHKLGWSEHSHDAETLGEYFADRAAQVEAMGWRPIEEAPRSIEYRCLLYNGITVVTGYWDGSRWVNERSGIGSTYPATHFMPPPQPPVKK